MTFVAVATQWTVGMGGPVGLRYEVLPVVLKMRRVPAPQWGEVFEGVRIMESEALKIFAERRGG